MSDIEYIALKEKILELNNAGSSFGFLEHILDIKNLSGLVTNPKEKDKSKLVKKQKAINWLYDLHSIIPDDYKMYLYFWRYSSIKDTNLETVLKERSLSKGMIADFVVNTTDNYLRIVQTIRKSS